MNPGIRTIAAACLASTMLIGNLPADATAMAVTAPRLKAPDAVARDFYTWYVGLMAHDKEPTDEPQVYARYVSKSLRASIARQIASPDGMEADYFVKAQDYMDSWIGHVASTPAMVRGNTARTVVTLGSGAKPWRLSVQLAKEDGGWKLASVSRR